MANIETGGSRVDDGDSTNTNTEGVLIFGTTDIAGTARAIIVDDDGHLQVDILSGGGGGTQYTEGDTDATITGTVMMMEDSADTLRPAQGDVTNGLDVDVTRSALPTGAATSANQLPDGHNVTVDNASISIDDGGGSITVDGTVDVQGDVAHDAVDSGDPIKLGGRASAETGKTVVAADDRVDAHFDTKGHLGTTIFSHDGTQALDVLNISGFGGLFNIPADLAGHAIDITSDGELRAHVYSTDLTEANAQYALCDASGHPQVDVLTLPDVTQSTASNLNAQVVGNVAHDAVNSGNPVLAGGEATDWDPDSDAEQGPSDVADGDRSQLTTDRQGAFVERVNARYHEPDNVSTTYNDSTTTATSTAIECCKYRYCTIGYELDESGAATDIQIFVEVSLNGTDFTVLTNDALGSLIYTDSNIGSGLEESYMFPIAANDIRIRIVATGTDASNTFTVTNFTIYLRN